MKCSRCGAETECGAMSDFAISPKLRTLYDDYHDNLDEGEKEWRRLSATEKCAHITKLCSAIPHRRILEVGSGEGSLLQRPSNQGFGESLYSLEVSSSAVQYIKNRSIPSLADVRVFDGYEIPYENGFFDLAVISHVLEHVEYPRKLIYEAARVSRYLFVEVPLELTIRMKGQYAPNSVGHINFYSPKTIRTLIQTCNLRIFRESLSNPSYIIYKRSHGGKALVYWPVTEVSLRLFPSLATYFFVYESCIICDCRT